MTQVCDPVKHTLDQSEGEESIIILPVVTANHLHPLQRSAPLSQLVMVVIMAGSNTSWSCSDRGNWVRTLKHERMDSHPSSVSNLKAMVEVGKPTLIVF